jgi:uncharacterized protein (DUF305 family)
MKITYLTALAAATALVASGCGDDGSGSAGAGASGNGVDRAFVAQMVPHHESAVQMAKVAQSRGVSKFVKQLADDIVRTQNEEISTMRREDAALDSAGVKAGSLGVAEHMTGMDGDTSMLRTAKPFDPAFVEMMVPHHEGAITMAKAELAKGQDPELKALAQQVIDAQQREIVQMRRHLKSAGGSTGSAGGTDGAADQRSEG